MREQSSQNSGTPSGGSVNSNTSNGSRSKSPDTEHPVRSFAARWSMACSIFFGWLAVTLAPWRYSRPKKAEGPPAAPNSPSASEAAPTFTGR